MATERSFLFLFEFVDQNPPFFDVVEFEARERISSCFEVDLLLASRDPVQSADVIGREARLILRAPGLPSYNDVDRYFHGIVAAFRSATPRGSIYVYRLKLVPKLRLLQLEKDARIFQDAAGGDVNLEQILTTIIDDAGADRQHYEPPSFDPAPTRSYCVQYRETDFNFISRLMEDEGILYYFVHEEHTHMLHMTDDSSSCPPIVGNPRTPYSPPSGQLPPTEVVTDFEFSEQLGTGRFGHRDFDLDQRSLDLYADFPPSPDNPRTAYEYPGGYDSEALGQHLARVRFEETASLDVRAEGRSDCHRFTAGHTFELTGTEDGTLDDTYLLVEVVHRGKHPQVLEGQTVSGEATYTNQFLCIPSSRPFRPACRTPRPRVDGVLTATVVGDASAGLSPVTLQELYSTVAALDPQDPLNIHVDTHGRVRVRFHWDTRGENSCWVRVSYAWTGMSTRGAQHLPHVGDQVIVSFVDGNLDRPVITGRLYYGGTAAEVAANYPEDLSQAVNKHRTVFRDEADNTIMLNAQRGQEQILVKSTKQLMTAVGDEEGKFVMGNEFSLRGGSSESIVIGSKLDVMMGVGASVNIGVFGDFKMAGEWACKFGYANSYVYGPTFEYKKGVTIQKGDASIESLSQRDNIVSAKDVLNLVGGASKKATAVILGDEKELTLSLGKKENPEDEPTAAEIAARKKFVSKLAASSVATAVTALVTRFVTLAEHMALRNADKTVSRAVAYPTHIIGILVESILGAYQANVFRKHVKVLESRIKPVVRTDAETFARIRIKETQGQSKGKIMLEIDPSNKTSIIEMEDDGKIRAHSKENQILLDAPDKSIDLQSDKASLKVAKDKSTVQMKSASSGTNTYTATVSTDGVKLEKKSKASISIGTDGKIELKNTQAAGADIALRTRASIKLNATGGVQVNGRNLVVNQ